MAIGLRQNCFNKQWNSFVDKNSKVMFQTALLLCLDPERAEDALTISVRELDFSRPPRDSDFISWERAVVKLSVVDPPLLSNSECAYQAWYMLQPGLRPLVRLDDLSRISFVLRLLLGYTSQECAELLGVQESELPALIAQSATQLTEAVENHSVARLGASSY